jgi:hypothetical protein
MDLQSSQRAKDLFLDYLPFPRNSSVQLGTKDGKSWFGSSATYLPLPSITQENDTDLLKAYLTDHFMQAENTLLKPFSLYLDAKFLNSVVAEAKLLGGHNELEWCSALSDPYRVQQIKERVEIQFLPCNKERYFADDLVSLVVDIKNVSTLIIKVRVLHQNSHIDQIH